MFERDGHRMVTRTRRVVSMCSVLSDFESDLNRRLSVESYLVMTDRHQTQIAVKTENTTHPVVIPSPQIPVQILGDTAFLVLSEI